LTAREHSVQELRLKLEKRGYQPELIEQALDALQASSLLNDARFTEVFVDNRIRKGQGPLRIRSGLREKGVGEQLIEECLRPYADQWLSLLQEVHDAKYGSQRAESNKELSKRARFLVSRGFPTEQIRSFLLE
jgi:regulatory protein